MGMAKKWMMEQDERGYSFIEGNICSDCFTDETIKNFIKENATSAKCDYCGKKSRKKMAAKFDDVMGVIVKGIALDWTDPDSGGITYEGREGGYATQPNRMSPAGVSMFYGSFDEKTAFLETYSPSLAKEDEVINIGKFITKKFLRVLDIGSLLPTPSVFDIENQHLIKPLRFLHQFADDIAKPIVRNGAEHQEYAPTQVVTEYFRNNYRYLEGKIDGIIYKSSRKGGKTACVLFCDEGGACNPEDVGNDTAIMELSRVSYKKASDYE
jgi:hypothetical protein